MSELEKTIDRLEQWVEYWEPHQVPELIADLRVLIGATKAAIQVAETLENAERIRIMYDGDDIESYAVLLQYVDEAIETLRAGVTNE